MYAAQIFAAARKDLPTLDDDIRSGKFSPLREWLREKVHKLGSLPANGDELMTAVTGSPLDVSIFVKYLNDKYSALYGL
jgi:carboxypeptidase Taq